MSPQLSLFPLLLAPGTLTEEIPVESNRVESESPTLQTYSQLYCTRLDPIKLF